MPIISVKDNENNRWKRKANKQKTQTNKKTPQKTKKTKTEKNKWDKTYSERVGAKWFCCAFKLGFL